MKGFCGGKRAFSNGVKDFKTVVVTGKTTVADLLNNSKVAVKKVFVSDNHEESHIMSKIFEKAKKRGIQVEKVSKKELVEISNTGKHGGVVANVEVKAFGDFKEFLEEGETLGNKSKSETKETKEIKEDKGRKEGKGKGFSLLLCERIKNEANLGMILRSVAAGKNLDGVLLTSHLSCQVVHPIVIKSSSGAIFRTKVFLMEGRNMKEELSFFKTKLNLKIVVADSNAKQNLFHFRPERNTNYLYVVGGESTGVSSSVKSLADHSLFIPMQNQVESLNVAVTAAFISYLPFD